MAAHCLGNDASQPSLDDPQPGLWGWIYCALGAKEASKAMEASEGARNRHKDWLINAESKWLMSG